ncbi:MAG: hypothetical protein FWE06_06080 [Oscillospiraceae bacterium]|nr:hypothetical protein [Oscillospiraceae bacterium]
MRKFSVILLVFAVFVPVAFAAAPPTVHQFDVPEATSFPAIEHLNFPETVVQDPPHIIASGAWDERMTDATAVVLTMSLRHWWDDAYNELERELRLTLEWDGGESELRRILTVGQQYGILPIFSVYDEDTLDALFNLFDELDLQDGVIMSEYFIILRRVAAERPNMARAFWVRPMFWDIPLDEQSPPGDSNIPMRPENPAYIVEDARLSEANIVVLPAGPPGSSRVETEYIQALQDSGLEVWVDVPPDVAETDLHGMVAQAPDGLITHDPSQLRRMYEQYGQPAGSNASVRRFGAVDYLIAAITIAAAVTLTMRIIRRRKNKVAPNSDS